MRVVVERPSSRRANLTDEKLTPSHATDALISHHCGQSDRGTVYMYIGWIRTIYIGLLGGA